MAAVDMQARVASLEQELATVRAQADSDAINAEHQSQAMEARYNALEAEHSQVRDGRLCPRRTGISHPSPGFRARQRIHEIHARHSEHAPGRIDDPAPRAPRPSPSGTRKLSAAFKIPDPHPFCPPFPQAIAERDAIKTQLTSARDELTAAKAQSATLDVSILQLTASTERLKVSPGSTAAADPYRRGS